MEQVDGVRRLPQELGELVGPIQVFVEEEELGQHDGHLRVRVRARVRVLVRVPRGRRRSPRSAPA